MKAGDRIHVTPHTIDTEGDGVGTAESVSFHCRGLFPGEFGEVRIDAISRHRPEGFGRVISLDTRHPARRTAPCEQHESRGGYCTGCALMPLDEAAQRELKQRMLREQYGLTVSEVRAAPSPLGYRHAAKRVALAINGRLTLGSYVRGSHRPANMDGCLVDHPVIVRAFDTVQAAARKMGLEAYDEEKKRGELRHVWAKTNGDVALVTLLVRNPNAEWVRPLIADLPKDMGVFMSAHAAEGNAMRGHTIRHLRGPKDAQLRMLDETMGVDALGFLQPNPVVAGDAYAALMAHDHVQDRALAFDLYAGVGFTTRALGRSFTRVSACESYPASAALLGITPSSAQAFLTEALANGEKPSLVLANPPRKGLGSDVVALLRQLGAPYVHIMSCGPEGLARDLAGLCEGAGGYRVGELLAFDTLPQTPHVELVARLALA